MNVGLVLIQLLVVLFGPFLVALWIQRRYGSLWISFFWGAVTFILSQVLRIPLLLGVQAVLNPLAGQWSEGLVFWANLLLLSLTSGLFEEGARYLILARVARKVRNWSEGLMYGVGHGGIEAILFVGSSAVTSIVLLLNGDALLAQTAEVAPQQAEMLEAQIEAIRSTPGYLVFVSLYERIAAMIFHVGASLLVLLAVLRRSWRLLLAAMLLHAGYNAAALIGLRYSGIWGAEIAVTLFTLVPIYLIRRLREPLKEENTIPEEGSETHPVLPPAV